MASNTTNFGLVQTLYIAFYQRPADPDGLVFWANEVTTKGRDAVINAFATSDEATALYGTITNDNIVTVVNQIYQALFNRDAEVATTTDAALGTVAGENFYVSGFKAGKFTPGQIALNVFDGVRGTDADVLAKKVAYANEFTAQIDGRPFSDANFGLLTTADAVTYNGDDVAAARAVLQGVTADTTVTPALVSNDVQTSIANAGDATFKLEGTVLNAPAATTQIRATFDSAKVGDGSANNGGTTGAAAFQQEDGADALVGAVVNGSDEGQIYTAKNGQTFDVRDLVTGAQRGNMFTTVNLGTSNSDTLTAAATASYINAGAGNDTVNGGAGADFLVGGAGDDQLSAGNGDSVIGGAGADTVVVAGNRADYTVADSATAVTLTKGTEVVTLVKVAGANSTENVKFADLTTTVDLLLNPVFTLTTANDTVAGTAAAEKIVGVVSSLTSEGTLQATDVIDGGDGIDTLSLDLKAGFTGFSTGSVKNVETVTLGNAGTIDRAFSTKGITGATTYTLNATGAAISLSDLAAAGVTVNVDGQTKGAFSVGYTAAALAGSADALTLGLNKVGTAEVKDAAGVVTTAQQAVAVTTTAGLESIAINATGANIVDLTNANASKVTAAGDGTLKVTAVGTALTSFDASAAKGAVNADLTAATGAGAITAVKGGAGDDAFTVDAADLAANVTLDGGTGVNSLTIKGGSGTLQPVMTGFQTLGLNTLSGSVTLSGKNASGLNTISLTAANALSGFDLTVANLTAPDLTVKSTGAQSAANVILTPATNLTYTTGASAAATTAKTTEVVSTAISAGEATAATINIGAYTSQAGTINVDKAATVTLNVASGKDTAGTTEMTNFNATLNAAKATSLTVNATGKLAASTLNANTAGSVALTATAGSSGIVDVNATKATSVTITAGDALDLTGSDFASAEQVTIAANKGAVTGTVALGKVNTLTLSGAAATSAVTLGSLGASTQEYAVNVSATGLKGGLNLGGATTKAGITVDVGGMTGASSLGALNGATVTVNATGALDTVTVGGITAKSAVTYNGAELKANSATVTAEGTSTALTATLNGGIAADTYVVNSVASSTSTTVSGDVGIGTNSVTIDGNLAAAAGGFTLNASGLTGAGTTTINLTGSSTVKNTITGTGIADVILGGAAADTINGGAGADVITGKLGADVLDGGAAADKFVYGSVTDDEGSLTGGSSGIAFVKSLTTGAASGAGTATLTYVVDGVTKTVAFTYASGNAWGANIAPALVTALNAAAGGKGVFASAATDGSDTEITLTAPQGVSVSVTGLAFSANAGTLAAATLDTATPATATALANVDSIVNFNFNEDTIDATTAFQTGGILVGSGTAAAAMTGTTLETAVQSLFTIGGALAADKSFGLFSFGGSNYLIGNATAVTSAATQGFGTGDFIVKLTGTFTGTLDSADFV